MAKSKRSRSNSRNARAGGGGASGSVVLDGGGLTIDDVVAVARDGKRVSVGPKAVRLMKASRAVVERAIKSGEALYGINTGFGSLSKKRIGDADLAQLQRNLVRSHAAGIGEPLPVDVVRGMMLLLAASLSRGLSGVRPVVAETIVAMLNAGVTPVVPSVGSVGASGGPGSAGALGAGGDRRGRSHDRVGVGIQESPERKLRVPGDCDARRRGAASREDQTAGTRRKRRTGPHQWHSFDGVTSVPPGE